MATLTSLTTNYFATPKEGFTTTLSSTISLGATTVPLNSITGYTNGAIITLVVDPSDPTKKQVFTGVVDTAGVQVTSVVWTEGTDQSHTTGATVVDYVTATHMAAAVKGLIQEHTQSGTHSTTLITARTEDTNPDPDADYLLTYDASAGALKKVLPSNLSGGVDGWTKNVLPSVSSVTYNGNRSYTMSFGSSIASYLSPGMRVRATRTVTAPTTVFSLDGSNDYYSKASPAGMTFTDDFVISCWVRATSYANATLVSRTDATPANGWRLYMNSSGQINLQGLNAGATNQRNIATYQSIPLNKWVHITAQLDMSSGTATTTTNYIMLDGVDVPISLSTSGTNPTTLAQSGDLTIGRDGSGNYFPGYITDVMIFNAKVTQATMRGYMSQKPTGSETSLISAYSNGSTTDLNTGNANNLTANNGATTSTSYAPYGVNSFGTPVGTYEYGIVTALASSTDVVVQFPEGSCPPTSGGVSAVDLSAYKCPYGFPAQEGRWRIESIYKAAQTSTTITALNQWFAFAALQIVVPIGAWRVGYGLTPQFNFGGVASSLAVLRLASSVPTNATYDEFTAYMYSQNGVSQLVGPMVKEANSDSTSTSTFSVYASATAGTTNITANLNAGVGGDAIYAKFALL